MNWKQLLNPKRPGDTTQKTPDHRVQFERDYDRTVFSTPVRRLQDKTQVFPFDPNDSVRTRLTHSLEVSTIARGLGRAVSLKLLEKGIITDPEMGRNIEAIAATCGLLHDLGNPPFGHSGEDAIINWFKKLQETDKSVGELGETTPFAKDLSHFQGNAQTLRLITRLQILAKPEGLNLSFGTLSASMKYISNSIEADNELKLPKLQRRHPNSKLGHFTSEHAIVERIRSETGTGPARNPITFLVEAADDTAYSVVDIEDATSKGIMSWPWLKELLENKLGEHHPVLHEALAGTYNILSIKPNVHGKHDDEKYDDKIYVRAFRTSVIALAVSSVTDKFMAKHDGILAGDYHKEIIYDDQVGKDVGALIKACKEIGSEHIYCTEPNLKLELMGRHIISDLLTFFWEGAKQFDGENRGTRFEGKISSLLSGNYKDVFSRARSTQPDLPLAYLQLQLVVDYVCGMTDSFARDLHKALKNC